MAHFNKAADIKQGFNFDKDKQTCVGFIHAMKIGDMELTADLTTLLDPEKPSDSLEAAVSVLSGFDWSTATTDSLSFAGQISTPNRQKVSELILMGNTVNIEVTFKYVIYEYDPVQKKYFKSSFSDAELKGIIEKNGSDLNLDVADDPSHEIQSPQNYAFRIGIKPAEEEQTINLALAMQKNITKKWGITKLQG